MNKANLVPLERAGLGSDEFFLAWILMRSQLSGVQRSEIVMHDVHYNLECSTWKSILVTSCDCWGLLVPGHFLKLSVEGN